MPTSGTFSTTNQYIKYNIKVTESNVNVANNTSDITVQVEFWRTNTGYETYGTGTVTVEVDGKQYTQAVTSSQKITNSGIVLFNRKITITHNSDGSKTVTVWAKISHSQFSSDWNSFDVTLTKIARTPATPSTFNITAGDGNFVALGDTVTLNWSGVSLATSYELQYSRGNSGWKAFKTVTAKSGKEIAAYGNNYSTTDSFTATDINVNGAGKAVKYRVRALNGSLASGWKESNTLTMLGGMDLKVNNAWTVGSVWIKVNGEWKRAKRVWIKVNNAWQYSK